MERSQIQSKFEPLRKRYRNWKAPVLTNAEQAEALKTEQTVSSVASNSVEGFLEEGSKLRLDLNKQVAGIVDRLHGETTTLEGTRLAVKSLSERLEDARNAKTAADALELLMQEHTQTMQACETQKLEEQAEFTKRCEAVRAEWAQHAEALEREHADQLKRIAEARARYERDYTYNLARARNVAADRRSERHDALRRQLKEQEAKHEAVCAERAKNVEKLEENNASLQQQIAQLNERLDTEPKIVRESAISKTSKEAKEEAAVLAKENELSIAVKERALQTRIEHIRRQEQHISQLEERIQQATAHNERLAIQAMDSKNTKREVA